MNAPPSVLHRMGVADGQGHMTLTPRTVLISESVKDTRTSKSNNYNYHIIMSNQSHVLHTLSKEKL